jgi:hypothetical protein
MLRALGGSVYPYSYGVSAEKARIFRSFWGKISGSRGQNGKGTREQGSREDGSRGAAD